LLALNDACPFVLIQKNDAKGIPLGKNQGCESLGGGCCRATEKLQGRQSLIT